MTNNRQKLGFRSIRFLRNLLQAEQGIIAFGQFLAKLDDFRIISKSDLIPNSPFAYLASLPPDLKAAIVKAFDEAPTKAKAAFDKLSDGKDRGFAKVDAKTYEPVVELIKFVDQLRKQKS